MYICIFDMQDAVHISERRPRWRSELLYHFLVSDFPFLTPLIPPIRSLYSYIHRLITTINSGRLCVSASTSRDARINFAMNRVPNGELKPVSSGIQWLLSRIAAYGHKDRPQVSYTKLTGHLSISLSFFLANLYLPKLP